MGRALSLDLRQRIVVAVENGLSRRAAAKRFAVSESCAIKLIRHWKRTGSVVPLKGAKKPFVLAPHGTLVRRLISSHPDHTLDELRDRLVAEGITVGDLKGTLLAFCTRLFSPTTEIRVRPSYFPFTEPS